MNKSEDGAMKSRETVESTTKEILSNMLRRDPDEIQTDDRLNEDLGLNSMDAVELVVDIKEQLGVTFGEDDVKDVEVVEDIVERALEKMEQDD